MDIYDFLQKYEIAFERHDHPALFTCEDAQRWIPHLDGAPTKNLFLRDKKGLRHFLLVVHESMQVDLKQLSQALQTSRIGFGSADRLKRVLGIEPGMVSLLALIRDSEHQVEVLIDRRLWEYDHFQCHPLVNTSTLIISKSGVEAFLRATNHSYTLFDTPLLAV